jgi:hypothetical protein
MDILIAFVAGVYLGGMTTEVVLSIYTKETKFETVKSALLWPVSTVLAVIKIIKR